MKHPKDMTTEELKSAKSKVKIPANIDPIKLADKIKGNMTTEWLKRYNKYFRSKSH